MDQSAFAPKKNNNTLTLVWSLALALFALLLAIVILNYFNIFPLSKTYPAAFGWLPTRSAVSSNPKLHLPLSSNLVTSADVYYRVVGRIKKVQLVGDQLTLTVSNGTADEVSISASIAKTVIRLKGSDTRVDVTEAKVGKNIEVIFVEDLKTRTKTINQLILEE